MKTPSWINSLKPTDSVLIIHHWDTDGICSASMVTEFLMAKKVSDIDFALPRFGTYRIDPGGNMNIPRKGYTAAVVLDYSVPASDLKNLIGVHAPGVAVYDHHLREPVNIPGVFYTNPVAEGEPCGKWPSTTWVLRKKLGCMMSHLVVLGIAGDMEERFSPAEFPEIERFMGSNGSDYADYIRAKELIDIHYKMNGEKLVKKLPRLILKNSDPGYILGNTEWRSLSEAHEKKIYSLVNREPDIEFGKKLGIYIIESKDNIISEVTRHLASRTGFRYIMVVNGGFFEDRTQIYVRSAFQNPEADMEVFRDEADRMGGQTGGKEGVAGIIIDDESVGGYIERLKTIFEGEERSVSITNDYRK